MTNTRAILLSLSLLAGCASPPPEAFLRGEGGRGDDRAVDLGRNTVGEACVQSGGAGSTMAEVYCGAWQQPSARVRDAGAGNLAGVSALLAAGPWRTALDNGNTCGVPRPVTLNGNAALQMDCTGRFGGWPYTALGTAAGGRMWLADGVVSAVPAVAQSVAVLSGQAPARVVSSAAVVAAQAERAGEQAQSTGDSRQFEALMRQGRRANLVDNPAAAATAYGAALAVQEKALGRDNPNLADPLMLLGLQLSNQGRFAEADANFRRAEALAPAQQGDDTIRSRLQFYEGLNLYNQGKLPEALARLRGAETGFTAAIDPAQLRPRPAGNSLRAALEDIATPASRQSQQALLGLVETWRFEAVILRESRQPAEALAKLRQAEELARNARVNQPTLTARLRRSGALTAAAAGQGDDALAGFTNSTSDFQQAYPGSRPLAQVGLLNAAELMRGGRSADAAAACRVSVQVMMENKSGFQPDRMAPCLSAFAAAAARADGTARQELLAQMFLATQLVRDSQTEQQISQASARLGAGAKDGKVGAAIRAQQDAAAAVALVRRRRAEADAAAATGQPVSGRSATALAEQERQALANLAEKEGALQAASPNYGQLVQQVTPAGDVLSLLAPDEAFVSVTLTPDDGWALLLRRNEIRVARVAGGAGTVDRLVARIRAAMTADTPAFDTAAAQALYTDLFGAFGTAMADVRGLTVAPSGSLLSLPFGVLLAGPAAPGALAEAPWLTRRMAVGHVPSAGNFVALRKVAGVSRAPNPWFGFGDFRNVSLAQARGTFGPGCGDSAALLARIPPLPSARQELSVAAKLLGAGPSDELLGDAFTVPAVLRQPLADYRVLHFATHAVLPSDLRCQTEPAIIASPARGAKDASSALLTASDLTEVKLDADLVILSACNSGGSDGRLTGGESLSGLARSFFYGGARGMLITHWEVSDQAATFLIADTLRRMKLEPGAGAARALQGAQTDLLDRAGKALPAEFAHPFYWAPFALIGQSTGEAGTRQVSARL